MSPGSALGAVGAFGITVGLLLLVLHLLRRYAGGTVQRAGAVPLAVLQRVSLGPRHGVALLRVGQRVLVVSVSDQGARLLTELGEEDARRVLAAEPTPPGGADAARRWPAVARWLSLVALLALLPGGLLAQVAARGAPPVVVAPTATVAAPPALSGAHAPTIDLTVGQGGEQLKLSGAVGIVVFLGVLTLLPALFLLMTSFTRILIVLHFLRSALGTQATPPGQLLVAIAVLLTGVVMHPALEEANATALRPYVEGRITQVQAYQRALVPFRRFMLANTREQDLAAFAEMSGEDSVATVEELATVTVVSAFVTSELRTAFQMGFVIFLPFVVVDLIVASVLMSLGMFMLPPAMISLPFKLLLFVLADGWTLVIQNLAASFRS
ncbi:MAG TPA: flagellar type III secretion system pore protein FliP [Gemmatimonadales bacterium]|nr:flagellar type III secretion system pore protein FliP [Gemmatimonadales bacterium]